MKVVLVGSGMIGRAWAICFARGGHDVILWNRSAGQADIAKEYVASLLPMLAEHDLLYGDSVEVVLSRIIVATSLSEALKDADYVQESVSEDTDVKCEVYTEIEKHCRADTILASSTSGLLPSTFTSHLDHPERCIVVHPLNPPYLIPAVDVVPSPATDPAILAKVANMMRGCGQAPIIMQKEDPGLLTIRIQGAIYHEAWRLVSSGLAKAEDVDIAVREGLALRWSFIGPFETADLNAPGGIRDFVARYGELYQELYPRGGPYNWDGALMDEVEADRRSTLPMEDHAERQLWRDKRLIALAAHKRERDLVDAKSVSLD
ncbi:3-hydroxyacyl-CoA dehydrogenase [Loktanella sp. Alg231-35]|uniref:3-hydroxyacyl-CoA dehydrogenase n=1 Tax=Loktanella sp. Alg231-35 TaxID=1922220 RepID=UPI001F3C8AC9|nr:3-hydroxyacyl-CoA dehydrogenase [Loktanella sp. Alg231-35]